MLQPRQNLFKILIRFFWNFFLLKQTKHILEIPTLRKYHKKIRKYRKKNMCKNNNCILGWAKFDLHFFIFSLTREFCSFWWNNGPREGFSLAKNIQRSLNEFENCKIGFFFAFSLLSSPVLSHFPISSESIKLQPKISILRGRSTDLKKIVFFLWFCLPLISSLTLKFHFFLSDNELRVHCSLDRSRSSLSE